MQTQNIFPKMAAHHACPPFCSVTGLSLDPAPDLLDQCLHLKIPSLHALLLLCIPLLAIGHPRCH